jgi:hypothetical protein
MKTRKRLGQTRSYQMIQMKKVSDHRSARKTASLTDLVLFRFLLLGRTISFSILTLVARYKIAEIPIVVIYFSWKVFSA